jgi:hypothetical protein
MFLNDDPPITGGRELWRFPKKFAQPSLRAEIDMLVGTLDYGPVRVATGTIRGVGDTEFLNPCRDGGLFVWGLDGAEQLARLPMR